MKSVMAEMAVQSHTCSQQQWVQHMESKPDQVNARQSVVLPWCVVGLARWSTCRDVVGVRWDGPAEQAERRKKDLQIKRGKRCAMRS